MKAVVMAGGFGTRIQPLTNSIPKPMLPIMNRPMMEHTIVSLRNLGIKEFIILLYFKPEVIKDYFQDGSKWGINITYVIPDDDYGTAGAVKKAQEYIGDENFIIISGDLVTDFDFQKIFDYHKEKKSKLTITLTSVENPLEFGVVIANEEGEIEKFLEKPSWGEVFSDTINTGIYVIEPEILDYIPKNKNFDFAKDLFPLLMRKGIDLMAGHAQGYWRDVGNPESYRDVYEDILSGKIKFELGGEAIKYPDGVLIHEGDFDIDESVEIVGIVVIGNDVAVKHGAKLNNVVIGNNVTIGSGCKIRNSVIWEDVEIGKNAHLDGCVICNHNKIGKNVTAKSGLILAEGCEIGVLVTIEKDVTIWPNKMIEDAAIVSRSIILGNKYKNSIFEDGMVIGKSNVELSCEMATKLAESFGAQLPIGSTVLVSRHYDKSSRMLKRAFLGGLLSSGVDVVDYNAIPSAVMRCSLSFHENYTAGVHFNQKLDDPTSTVITFYNNEALRINNDVAKKIEKAFFKETFRRVDYTQIGQIFPLDHTREYYEYKKGMETILQSHRFKCLECRIAVDVMHGLASEVFPTILNDLNVEHIMFNAYEDEHRLANINNTAKRSYEDMGAVIRALHLDAGFVLFPHGQRLDIISDEGILLTKQTSLYVVLSLLNMDAIASGEKKRVYLPTWAADIVYFDHLEIERGQYSNFKASKMKTYDLVASGEGNFTFTEFATHRDSMYATLKILQLMVTHSVKLSDIINLLPKFFYSSFKIPCSQALKGKMMRMFLQDAKGKKSSMLDGVKIWLDQNDWILMIPDQYSDHLNIYIQAETDESGEKIYTTYCLKIVEWTKIHHDSKRILIK
ncbi:Nucleotidyl transferase (plasmid) [Sulfuricurvum kujiense DSM 16994]|uniref:Nucleotidyl transferase n=1 Tax=Sulfuricurvum kujiense (strain ATCC BAA-921 / DSM 16994 / JCM 11577 / YK-1) TaxID=709032 RepID=E4U3P1_SULKY|nr:sugar phosphate nucleotidyltransferase [Sulfuricurvum kujiense]ADR35307.1 Nucleotidyl transferase [Sulfuricurvum kujiense DSM 16994]